MVKYVVCLLYTSSSLLLQAEIANKLLDAYKRVLVSAHVADKQEYALDEYYNDLYLSLIHI